ncbi:2-succinyl-6-hydroxy-2,4-cyclohexadiene-1-carboxylate synthase [Litchfieldia alkalitelluris]|uniref:2-succinyl-6-hydroxy-2, 4-cyclohexadiene-1-carboxylate synthase n=1 Tax=Litchfieldia alkalitelluris TaxID=304268 RepID=UPI000997236F|nr:2-succinyl-6-hydroxy-2,4-cyclohexadiene-1-carboxylate synthase [Litchfieldia alkalitelluris]
MFLTINDKKYHVNIVGQGSPLLFLHGFTGSTDNWLEPISSLISQYRCILIDLIGHGKSDSPEGIQNYTFDYLMKDVLLILDKLEIDKVGLIGYSMGGRLALALAIEFPERFTHLVLESSSPGLNEETDRQERMLTDESLASFIEEEGIKKFVTYWENIPLFASQQNMPDSKKVYLHNQRLNNNPMGLANSLKGMGTGVQLPYWGSLHKLNMPVLLLCGELDDKFCIIARKMSSLISNSTFKKINGAGHAIHMEQPEKFGRIVSGFLQSKNTT